MINKIKNNRKILLFVFAFILIIPSIVVGASGGNSGEPKIVRPKANQVENMTIIIGTHMIALEALTQELNDIAQATAQNSGQDKVYYKSELTDGDRSDGDDSGIWYEIQNAQSIDDISVVGTESVEDDVIDGLTLTHYTNKEGRTFDLNTGSEVDIFEINDVYDVGQMTEIQNLKLEYDVKKDLKPRDMETDAEKESLAKIQNSLKSVFELKVKDETTAQVDLELSALKKYYDYVVLKGATERETELLTSIRNAVNAKRKEIVVSKLIEKIDEEINQVDELINSYSTAKNELTSSQSQLLAQKAVLEQDENSTLIQQKRVNLINNLIDNVKKNDYKSADENLRDILALDDIVSLMVSDRERQLSLVRDLLKKAKDKYYQLAFQGESEEYKQATAKNSGLIVLDNLKVKYQEQLKREKQEMSLIYDMLMKLLTAVEEKRSQLKTEIDDLLKKIGEISAEIARQKTANTDMLASSATDSFKGVALDSLKDLLSSLSEKLASLEDFLAGKDSELTKQTEQLKELQEEYQKALDKNDLLRAKEAKSKILELEEKLKKEKSLRAENLASLNSQISQIQAKLDGSVIDVSERAALEAQKLSLKSEAQRLGASLSDKSKVSNQILREAINDSRRSLSEISMTKQDIKNLQEGVLVIKEMMNVDPVTAYQAAVEVEEEIERKLDGLSEDSDAKIFLTELSQDVSVLVEENRDNSNPAQEVRRDDLEDKIDIFAQDQDLSEIAKELLSVGALSELMQQYGSVTDDMLVSDLNSNQKVVRALIKKSLAKLESYGDRASGLKAVLINKKIKNGELYASAESVAEILNLKYIWDGNLVRGWLINKGKSYCFVQGNKNVVLSNGKNKTMNNLAVFESDKNDLEGVLWLPKSFLVDEFKVAVQSISTVEKTIVYTEPAYKKMKELLDVMKT